MRNYFVLFFAAFLAVGCQSAAVKKDAAKTTAAPTECARFAHEPGWKAENFGGQISIFKVTSFGADCTTANVMYTWGSETFYVWDVKVKGDEMTFTINGGASLKFVFWEDNTLDGMWRSGGSAAKAIFVPM
jgi:hypothetical protein